MEWIFVGFLYLAALAVAIYRFGTFGFIGLTVFGSIHALGLYQGWSPNPLVPAYIAGFSTFIAVVMIPHWYLLATGREGIIGRNRPPDQNL